MGGVGVDSAASTSGSHSQHDGSPSSSSMPAMPKDCKACSGAQHLLKAFSRYAGRDAGEPSIATPHQQDKSSSSTAASASSHASLGSSSSQSHASAGQEAQQQQQNPQSGPSSPPPGPPRVLCPPNTWEIGNATWTFLHTVAAYYPEQPSREQQEDARGLFRALGAFYPCEVCREHLQEQLQRTPPEVASNASLNVWLCRLHNEVNEMLGKPPADCTLSRILERWRGGPPDGSCD